MGGGAGRGVGRVAGTPAGLVSLSNDTNLSEVQHNECFLENTLLTPALVTLERVSVSVAGMGG